MIVLDCLSLKFVPESQPSSAINATNASSFFGYIPKLSPGANCKLAFSNDNSKCRVSLLDPRPFKLKFLAPVPGMGFYVNN